MDKKSSGSHGMKALQGMGNPVDVRQRLAPDGWQAFKAGQNMFHARFDGIGRLARVKGDFMQIALFVDRENGQRESVVFKGGFQKLIGLAGKRARALEIKSRLGHRAESGRWKDSALSYQPAQFCDSRIGVFLMRDGAEETAVAVKQDDRGGVIHRV